MTSVIPAQPEPSNGACRWGKPTAMERYVHVTSKSPVNAIQLFEQSHGNIDIPTPVWSNNGVQKYSLTFTYKSMSLPPEYGSKLFSYSGMC